MNDDQTQLTIATYNFDLGFQAGQYTVSVDTTAERGYFEHDILGDQSGGRLTFERNDAGQIEIIDYDGVWALPREVIDGLLQHNIIVSGGY